MMETKHNLGIILGALALTVSLANSYFIYDLSQSKNEPFSANGPTGANTFSDNPQIEPAPNRANAVTPAFPPPADQSSVLSGPNTSISFKKMEHDFGTIRQDTENPYAFEFTNTGKNPLIISDAKGSCGCTVPEYPKEPIPPGGTGKIKVVYSPGKQEGSQVKNVTITANTEPQQTVLTIKANVKP